MTRSSHPCFRHPGLDPGSRFRRRGRHGSKSHDVDQVGFAACRPACSVSFAERAGVAISTVSRVLNGHSTVTDGTRAHILAVMKALRYVPHVGARSLSECLALQAREADRYDPCMARLIDNLEALAKGEIARLKRLCEVDDEDFADMLAELRGYDPKPGLRFGGAGEGDGSLVSSLGDGEVSEGVQRPVDVQPFAKLFHPGEALHE